MDLREKTVVVTGGAVRLGKTLALAVAGAGGNVVVHYGRSQAEAEQAVDEIRSLSASAVSVQADLLEPAAAAERIFDVCQKEFGPADVLVNSAAIFESGTLAATTADDWDRHFSINLKAPFLLCRAFAERLPQEKRGHIVNIADWRGTRPLPGHFAYTLTKSGLVSMTKLLAQELAPQVQVNAIAPGAILPPPGAEADYLRRLQEQIPLRRTGSPGDVAEALLFLLGSDFVTGEILHVAGGEQL